MAFRDPVEAGASGLMKGFKELGGSFHTDAPTNGGREMSQIAGDEWRSRSQGGFGKAGIIGIGEPDKTFGAYHGQCIEPNKSKDTVALIRREVATEVWAVQHVAVFRQDSVVHRQSDAAPA